MAGVRPRAVRRWQLGRAERPPRPRRRRSRGPPRQRARAVKTAADLLDRLRALHARTAETPLFNPVFQLSLDLSRLIEADALDLDGVEALVAELECEALKARAGRLRALIAPVDQQANRKCFAALLE